MLDGKQFLNVIIYFSSYVFKARIRAIIDFMPDDKKMKDSMFSDSQ